MTKKEFTDKMAERAGISKADAQKAYDAFLGVTKDYLVAGERVSFLGLGTFTVCQKEARTARNPRTGEMLEIPARKAVKFKAGADLSKSMK
ncbi:MAG: HU family DNA-binding protein [Bacteroidales bacterium]|jgi:DNA-binding protein HU-beta|nr:HU family DNA-binding protein [Bacteroidales bacterium]MBO7180688.1 HU family DNA-binding protein [Bacteroidales bacterium]MBO7228794.1 HU family DNA-binding protein [Bacteroidales bacterium]MBQ1191698.1 HU family DNA-binding protein [Bacteroidales bacterium]MBQ2303052.1 HU family DNA-binding protein [Bacteroidales bacterium]